MCFTLHSGILHSLVLYNTLWYLTLHCYCFFWIHFLSLSFLLSYLGLINNLQVCIKPNTKLSVFSVYVSYDTYWEYRECCIWLDADLGIIVELCIKAVVAGGRRGEGKTFWNYENLVKSRKPATVKTVQSWTRTNTY